MAPLLEKFRRDIAGILWLALALFLGMALISYHPSDPSFNSVNSGGTLKSVSNLCGYFGSFLSDLLYQLLGIAAWVLVMGSLRQSIFSFKGKTAPFRSWRLLWVVLLIFISASLCSLYFPEKSVFAGRVPVGGILGLLVSGGLVHIFNRVGVGIILWASAAVLIIFYTEKRIHELAPWSVSFLRGLSRNLVIGAAGLLSLFKGRERSKEPPLPTVKENPVQEISPEKFSLKQMIGLKGSDFNITEQKSEPIRVSKLRAAFQKTQRQIENWELPPLDLLLEAPTSLRKVDEREIHRNARLVEKKLEEFDVHGQVVEVRPGPAVTMYEFRPAASTKINDITKLADDLSLALSAESLRIIAPIPGRDVVGIETSNSKRDEIFMKDIVESQDFWSEEIKLPVALGKGVSGEAKVIDLRKIPQEFSFFHLKTALRPHQSCLPRQTLQYGRRVEIV